jgi:hypothetical protein
VPVIRILSIVVSTCGSFDAPPVNPIRTVSNGVLLAVEGSVTLTIIVELVGIVVAPANVKLVPPSVLNETLARWKPFPRELTAKLTVMLEKIPCDVFKLISK